MEGLIFLLLCLLGAGKGKQSQSASGPITQPKQLPPPGVMTFANAWKVRTTKLVARAKSGMKWLDILDKLFKTTDAAVGASRWIGIESGGDVRSTTTLDERGLAQGMKSDYTAAEWAELKDPKTTDERHAQLAVKLILAATKAAGGPFVTSPTIGLGKLYHGLPLFVKELKSQKLLGASVAEAVRGTLAEYKPSVKVASYVKGQHAVTGDTRQDLTLRFLAPAAVVAYGEPAITLLDTLARSGTKLPNA